MCLQSYHLCQSQPEVALRLLEEYFALGDHFHDCSAHTFRAQAHLALGDIEKAVTAYEAALAREQEYPNVRTEARIELPFLIATFRIRPKYEKAMALLADTGILLFPMQRFKYQASLALILAESDPSGLAKTHAEAALASAQYADSGLRYHLQLGLVGDKYEGVQMRLAEIASNGIDQVS